MSKNRKNWHVSLSESESEVNEIFEKSQDNFQNYEFPSKPQDKVFEKYFKSKLMMKVLSCEDFQKMNTTFVLDRTMKERKKNV